MSPIESIVKSLKAPLCPINAKMSPFSTIRLISFAPTFPTLFSYINSVNFMWKNINKIIINIVYSIHSV